jgi:hypothetical protein
VEYGNRGESVAARDDRADEGEHAPPERPEAGPPPEATQPEQRREAHVRSEADLNPRSIELQERELEFMRTLAPLIPTPRAAKRLVNVYRLVRSLVLSRERTAFLGNVQHPGDYQATMLLTAAVTGFPAAADELIERVAGAPPDQTWRAFVSRLPKGEGDEARLYAGLRRLDPASSSGLRLDVFQRSLPRVRRFSFGAAR